MNLQKNNSVYGHWRSTLQLALDISSQTKMLQTDVFSQCLGAIVLSQTAFEIYCSEAYFLTLKRAEEPANGYKKYSKLRFIERLEVLISASGLGGTEEAEVLVAELKALNRLRNYSVHHAGPTAQQETLTDIQTISTLEDCISLDAEDVQSMILNKSVALWSIALVCKGIRFLEQSDARSILNQEYCEFCEEILENVII